MLSEEEETRKKKIEYIVFNEHNLPYTNQYYAWIYMMRTYTILDNFKDLNPDVFFTKFLLIIDDNTELFPITEKLHDMFVKIIPYLDPNMGIMTYLENLSFYKFCIDVGYKKVNYLTDVRMPVRVGVINPVCDTFNETPLALLKISYIQKYLTTI